MWVQNATPTFHNVKIQMHSEVVHINISPNAQAINGARLTSLSARDSRNRVAYNQSGLQSGAETRDDEDMGVENGENENKRGGRDGKTYSSALGTLVAE